LGLLGDFSIGASFVGEKRFLLWGKKIALPVVLPSVGVAFWGFGSFRVGFGLL
jgi:hypothetical protein